MVTRNYLQRENIREEIVTIPWYNEGPGKQQPELMQFICTMRSFAKGAKFSVDGVDDYQNEGKFSDMYFKGDPMDIVRLNVAPNRKKLRHAIAKELADITGGAIEPISNSVMWYSFPGDGEE